jgi:uncharacterized membrane protein
MMILIIFFAVIIAGLITVVADASTVFLAERQLQAIADGAAAAAAQRADIAAVYQGNAGETLPLSPTEVTSAVNDYVTAPAHLPHECAGTEQIRSAQADGPTVTVELSCRVPLPFVNVVAQLWSQGVAIDVVAHARSAVTPAG